MPSNDDMEVDDLSPKSPLPTSANPLMEVDAQSYDQFIIPQLDTGYANNRYGYQKLLKPQQALVNAYMETIRSMDNEQLKTAGAKQQKIVDDLKSDSAVPPIQIAKETAQSKIFEAVKNKRFSGRTTQEVYYGRIPSKFKKELEPVLQAYQKNLELMSEQEFAAEKEAQDRIIISDENLVEIQNLEAAKLEAVQRELEARYAKAKLSNPSMPEKKLPKIR